MTQRTDAPVASVAPPRHRASWRQTFSSLRYPGFRLLWTSTLLISGGNRIQQITIGWLAYNITGSALHVGAVTGLRAMPLLFGPLIGVVIDRVDRRRLLLICHAYLAVISVGFAVLILLDLHRMWHLYAFTLLTGVVWSFTHPVRQALVANAVPREALMNAVALNSMAFNASRVLGPAIGGALIALVGPGYNFLIQGLAFALVFLVIIPFRPIQASDFSRNVRASVLSNLWQGFRHVAHDPILLAAISATVISTLFLTSFVVSLMPVYAAEVVKTGPGGLGLLYTAIGAGGLVGTMFVASMGNIQRKGVTVLVAVTALAAGVIIFSQVSVFWLALGLLMGIGFFQMIHMTTNNTIVQLTTPDELRGRVLGIYMMDMGMIPLGGLMGGLLAQLFSAPTALLLGGATGMFFIALTALSVPKYRALRG